MGEYRHKIGGERMAEKERGKRHLGEREVKKEKREKGKELKLGEKEEDGGIRKNEGEGGGERD